MPMLQESDKRKVLILTAVEAEREAVLRGLNRRTCGSAGNGGGGGNDEASGKNEAGGKDEAGRRFQVELAGVGPVAAAITATRLLAAGGGRYGAVISAGIGGGFEGQAPIGSIVVSSLIAAPDLGAETPQGFSSLEELGFGSSSVAVDPALAAKTAAAIAACGVKVRLGPALTLATVTGTAATASVMAARVPGAASEGMEGYGVAAAAEAFGLPALEIRAISNAIGPRDKSKWRIGEALQVLETASAALLEVWK